MEKPCSIKEGINKTIENYYVGLCNKYADLTEVLININTTCNDIARHEPELELYVRKRLYSLHKKKMAHESGEKYVENGEVSHMNGLHELRIIQNKLFLDDRPVLGVMNYKLVSSPKDIEGGLAELTMRICVEAKPG